MARSATARYGAIRREDEMHSRRRPSSLPASKDVTGIAGSWRCLGGPAGGWQDRVERVWRREGLKVPQKQKPRGRLWLDDGSCVRLRPMHAIKELRVLAERWCVHYNTIWPHSSLGYRPPAPEAWLTNNVGMGKWQPLRASHFSTLPASAI